MEIKKIEKCDYVMFPRLQEQGVEFKHVERDTFKAEQRHVKGHGDFWLLHQQAKPHVVVHIQLARTRVTLIVSSVGLSDIRNCMSLFAMTNRLSVHLLVVNAKNCP